MKYSSKLLFLGILCLLFLSVCRPLTEKEEVRDESALPRNTPESQGVSSERLITFLDSAEASGIAIHGVMVLRHGNVVTEGWWHPYQAKDKHQLYSLSKSFTSTAVGFAVQEGLLNLEDTVYKFFPEYAPEVVSEKLSRLQVKHLITMSTGHLGKPMELLLEDKKSAWVKTFLNVPIENEPGSVFLYNTSATFMLSAIVQKLSGQTVEQYLKPRFFDPLGIKDTEWLLSPDGINTGGYGFKTDLESVAKLGQFYLQKGMWNGVQILNEKWVEDATKRQIESTGDTDAKNDWSEGYGYQFWRNTVGGYRADGAFGQFSIVLPAYDAVIAINSESIDMGATMQLVWNYIIPAFKEEEIEANPEVLEELKYRYSHLYQEQPAHRVVSPRTSKISGRTFALEGNEQGFKTINFDFYENILELTFVKEDGDDLMISNGMHSWVIRDNQIKMDNYLFPSTTNLIMISKVAAIGTWKSIDTLQLNWQFIELVHGDQLTLTFDDEGNIDISFLNSLSAKKGETDYRKNIKGKRVIQ